LPNDIYTAASPYIDHSDNIVSSENRLQAQELGRILSNNPYIANYVRNSFGHFDSPLFLSFSGNLQSIVQESTQMLIGQNSARPAINSPWVVGKNQIVGSSVL